MVRLFRLLNRFHRIQTGDIGADQCALGILDSGERNAGNTMLLQTRSRDSAMAAIATTGDAIVKDLAEVARNKTVCMKCQLSANPQGYRPTLTAHSMPCRVQE